MVAISNFPAFVATSWVTFERRSFSGRVTKLTLIVGWSFSKTCFVNCSICTIWELLTVATVSVVVEEDEDWLEGLHAASIAKSKAMLVRMAIARVARFIANFSLSNASMQ